MWKLFSSYHINNLWLWRKWTRRASNAARTIIYHQTLKIKRKKWNVMRHNNENDWTSIICVCVGEIWMLMEDSFVWWRETEEGIKMKDISSATTWTFLTKCPGADICKLFQLSIPQGRAVSLCFNGTLYPYICYIILY